MTTSTVPPELLAILTAPDGRDRALHLARELGHIVGRAALDGVDLTGLADRVADRAATEDDGPDADSWADLRDLYASWAAS